MTTRSWARLIHRLGSIPPRQFSAWVKQKNVNQVDDQTLILADISRKAMKQVKDTVRRIASSNYSQSEVEKLTDELASGKWTHDYPISVEEARQLGCMSHRRTARNLPAHEISTRNPRSGGLRSNISPCLILTPSPPLRRAGRVKRSKRNSHGKKVNKNEADLTGAPRDTSLENQPDPAAKMTEPAPDPLVQIFPEDAAAQPAVPVIVTELAANTAETDPTSRRYPTLLSKKRFPPRLPDQLNGKARTQAITEKRDQAQSSWLAVLQKSPLQADQAG